MNYKLNTSEYKKKKGTNSEALKSLLPLLSDEKKQLTIAMSAILLNTLMNLISPIIIAHTIDTHIIGKNFHGVLVSSGILLAMFLVGAAANYVQIISMGGVGRRVLFKLRNSLFTKIQSLPVAFFNQNKAGDLISRINNDTDKLNQFFSQALMQFIGNFFLIVGAGVFLVSLNVRLGLAALLPALVILVLTKILSGWIKRTSSKSLQSVGGMSAEIQESLANFKVVVAFNRLDYFRNKFNDANVKNYNASVKAGIASNILIPIYGIASNIAQIIVLAYGITLITSGQLTIGLLIGFLLYVSNFYTPLRHVASIWSSFQLAFASLDRISEVMKMANDMQLLENSDRTKSESLLEFKNVSFGYPEGREVLHKVNFNLLKGKTYALVGPTGGGKTTTVSLMARLYDPTIGTIMLDGRDITSYTDNERTKKIGFILQEPFLFTGTVRDNILYGNTEYQNYEKSELEKLLQEKEFNELMKRFDSGVDTKITNGDAMSLGQKQIIAFMRAVLRKPELLILDEATANIDTVTEEVLEAILEKLPKETTRVIIAHRLNTIQNADEIFFVNSGEVVLAGSFDHALEMLMGGKRVS